MALAQDNTTRGSPLRNTTFEILVGTYEEFILGYSLTKNSEGGWALSQSFTNHSHCGSVRSVAVSSRYLASGSADESVRLFDLKHRTEHGYLQQHIGTITCLQFYKNSHLFTGSDDGNICVWKTHDWQCEKTLNAHKGGVVALAIHPSGKLALSIGKDRTLKTWNLIKGRTAYVTNIKAVAELVTWSPSADHYAVAVNNEVHIYSVAVAGITHVIDFKYRVSAVVFLTDEIVAIGGEAAEMEIHNVQMKEKLSSFAAHEKRVRSLAVCRPPKTSESAAGGETENLWFVSASNDGFIKLWNVLLAEPTVEPEMITSINTTCRITSLAIWQGVVTVKQEDETLEEEKQGQTKASDTSDHAKNDKPIKSAEKPKAAKRRPQAHVTVDYAPASSKTGPQTKSMPKSSSKPVVVRTESKNGEETKGKQTIRTASGKFSVQELPQAFKRSLDITAPVKKKKKRT